MSTYSRVFALRLREERQRLGLSQGQLAQSMGDLLGVRIDTSAVSRIENPTSGRVIKLDEAAAAADALGVPLSALLSELGLIEVRLQELRHERERHEARVQETKVELRRAMAASADVEREIKQLEAQHVS